MNTNETTTFWPPVCCRCLAKASGSLVVTTRTRCPEGIGAVKAITHRFQVPVCDTCRTRIAARGHLPFTTGLIGVLIAGAAVLYMWNNGDKNGAILIGLVSLALIEVAVRFAGNWRYPVRAKHHGGFTFTNWQYAKLFNEANAPVTHPADFESRDIGQAGRQRLSAELWARVTPGCPLQVLAQIYHALEHIDGQVDRQRFFERCDCWPEGGPPRPHWVPISAGTFVMGSPDTERDRDRREGPQHEVTLAAFELAANAVTNAEYAQFDRAIRRRTSTAGCPPRSSASIRWWT